MRELVAARAGQLIERLEKSDAGRRCSAGRERDERGAVAPFVALLTVVLLFSAAFITDFGMQRVARADVQALADIVAMDLARDLDGKQSAAALSQGLQARANASMARNPDVVGEGVSVTPVLGQLLPNGRFERVSGSTVPTAVKVDAHTTVGFLFGGVTDVDSGDAEKNAVAVASMGACFAVGSYIANVDSAQSALLNPILGGLLGSSVDLQAVGYNGLASAGVKLTELVEVHRLAVGSVDELLKLDHLRVGDLYLAIADVLDRQGKGSQASVLRSLSVTASTPTIEFGDLLSASATDEAALGASFNVLDLVTGAAYLANKGHAIDVPSLAVTVPGVASVGIAKLTVIEAPRISCGGAGTEARTAQVKLELPMTVNAQTVQVSGVGSVGLKKTDLKLSVDLGRAIGTLNGITCKDGSATDLTVDVASSVVGGISLSSPTGMGVTVDVDPTNASPVNGGLFRLIQSVVGLLSTTHVKVDTSLNVGVATSGHAYATPLTFNLPDEYNTKKSTGNGALLGPLSASATAGTKVEVTAKLLGILGVSAKTYLSADTTGIFNAVINPIASYVTGTLLNATVASLQSSIIDPLSKALGLTIGGADAFAIPSATCTNPRLRGFTE